jgi:hypothetical protein
MALLLPEFATQAAILSANLHHRLEGDKFKEGYVMSGTEISSDINKPDPTFLKPENSDIKKPLGLPVQNRQPRGTREPAGTRLSRKELENLLDSYYAVREQEQPVVSHRQDHARKAGHKLVRNLTLASSAALFFGFALGLYSLSNQGSETSLGKSFNTVASSLWSGASTIVSNTLPTSAPAKPIPVGKPVKTASLVVSDVAGTIQAGIPLKLSLNGMPENGLVKIKVMNVPADAVLTAGKRDASGVWTLVPEDLADVSLVLSSARKGPLSLEVEVQEARTGELLSPTKQIRVAVLEATGQTIKGF